MVWAVRYSTGNSSWNTLHYTNVFIQFQFTFLWDGCKHKAWFFNAKYLTFGGVGIKQSQISIRIFFIWVFLGLEFPLWHPVSVLPTADAAVHWYVRPPFMSRSPFVITQIEQHDLELFKAACTFCKKKNNKKLKKKRNKRLFNNVC